MGCFAIDSGQGKCKQGTSDSDRREADMVSSLYVSELCSFRRYLVSLFW